MRGGDGSMNEGRAVPVSRLSRMSKRSKRAKRSVQGGKVTLKQGRKCASRGKASKERVESSGGHVVKTSEQQSGLRSE